jgi:hypothetical protein
LEGPQRHAKIMAELRLNGGKGREKKGKDGQASNSQAIETLDWRGFWEMVYVFRNPMLYPLELRALNYLRGTSDFGAMEAPFESSP